MKRYIVGFLSTLVITLVASISAARAAPFDGIKPSFTVVLPASAITSFKNKVEFGQYNSHGCQNVTGQVPSGFNNETDDNSAFPISHLYPQDKSGYENLVYKCTTVSKNLYRHFSEAALDVTDTVPGAYVRLLVDGLKLPHLNCPLRKCSSDGLYHHSGQPGIPACGYCQ